MQMSILGSVFSITSDPRTLCLKNHPCCSSALSCLCCLMSWSLMLSVSVCPPPLCHPYLHISLTMVSMPGEHLNRNYHWRQLRCRLLVFTHWCLSDLLKSVDMNTLSHFPWENIYILLNGLNLLLSCCYCDLQNITRKWNNNNNKPQHLFELEPERWAVGAWGTNIRVQHETMHVAFTSHSRVPVCCLLHLSLWLFIHTPLENKVKSLNSLWITNFKQGSW